MNIDHCCLTYTFSSCQSQWMYCLLCRRSGRVGSFGIDFCYFPCRLEKQVVPFGRRQLQMVRPSVDTDRKCVYGGQLYFPKTSEGCVESFLFPCEDDLNYLADSVVSGFICNILFGFVHTTQLALCTCTCTQCHAGASMLRLPGSAALAFPRKMEMALARRESKPGECTKY